MKVTDKIGTSVATPNLTDVMWHNPSTGELKIFGNNGWELVGGGRPINVLYKELKELKDSAQLIPGMLYRITDYVATTSDPESRSANHPFDIIVTADDKKTLNENARAIQHEGDEYFKHCNLATWRLKYCIDNDTNRFLWALKEINGYEFMLTPELGSVIGELISDKDNTIEGYNYHFIINFMGIDLDLYTNTLNVDYTNTNEPIICYTKFGEEIGEMPLYSIKYKTQEGGKGVIYEMIDEYNNRAPYDFKGIQFKRYEGYVENYPDIKIDLTPRMPGIVITNEDNPIYAFLCCTTYDLNIDTSIGTFNYSLPKNYYISDYGVHVIQSIIYMLPNVILDTYDFSEINKVYIGNNSHNITIKGGASTAIIEDTCCNILSIGGVDIKRNCKNLINVNKCGEDTNYIIINGAGNVEPLYRFNYDASGYYKLNVPQEIRDWDRYNKIVNVWKNGNKLCWYHPEIGIINSDV